MGCLYVLALEVGSLVGLSACGACPGGWSPAQRAPFQGRVGRHGGESVAAGSDSRVPLGAGAPPTRRLRGPTRRVARSHWERRASPLALPVDVATSQWEGEWDFQTATRKASGSTGARLPRPTGSLAGGEAPSPGPTRQREAPSACAHWEAARQPCARHFLSGTFLPEQPRSGARPRPLASPAGGTLTSRRGHWPASVRANAECIVRGHVLRP